MTASGLPWSSELKQGAGLIRDKTQGIHLTIKCGEEELQYEGELSPKVVNGAKGKATYEEFGEGTGELTGAKEAGNLQIAGKDYMAGFEEGDEVITTGKTKPEKGKEENRTKKLINKTIHGLGDSISFGLTEGKNKSGYPTDEPSGLENGFTNFFAADLAKKESLSRCHELVAGRLGERPMG